MADRKTIPILFENPSSRAAIYANQMVVQHDSETVYLNFFELLPPMFTGTDDDRAKQIEEIQSVTASCVARVAVPASRLVDFMTALQETHRKFEEHKSED